MNARQITRTAIASAAVAAMSIALPATASALSPEVPFEPDLDLQIPQPDPCMLIPELCVPGDDDEPGDEDKSCDQVDDCLAIPDDDDDCPEVDDCFTAPEGGEDPDPETPDPEVLDEEEENPDAPVRANPNFTG